jgi:hypothetical protein
MKVLPLVASVAQQQPLNKKDPSLSRPNAMLQPMDGFAATHKKGTTTDEMMGSYYDREKCQWGSLDRARLALSSSSTRTDIISCRG